jgi:hypothetical protein
VGWSFLFNLGGLFLGEIGITPRQQFLFFSGHLQVVKVHVVLLLPSHSGLLDAPVLRVLSVCDTEAAPDCRSNPGSFARAPVGSFGNKFVQVPAFLPSDYRNRLIRLRAACEFTRQLFIDL